MPKWYGGSTLNPDGLISPQEQWRIQWKRALRWYDRVQQIKEKALKEELNVSDMDVVVAFFQNCCHVRDWIAFSKPDMKGQLEDLFRNHFEMRACRNICDGFKHKKLDNPNHPDPDFNLIREYDYFEIVRRKGNSPIKYRAVFTDGTDVRKYDLFELIQACIDLWRRFLDDTGLAA